MYSFTGLLDTEIAGVNDELKVSVTELTVPKRAAIATTTTSPEVTSLGNKIGEGEQAVISHPPLFCWTNPDEACTEGRVANKSMKTDEKSKKITRENSCFLGIDFPNYKR